MELAWYIIESSVEFVNLKRRKIYNAIWARKVFWLQRPETVSLQFSSEGTQK